MLKIGHNWSNHLENQLRQAGVQETKIPYTLAECYQQQQQIKHKLREVQNNSRKYRENEQISQLYCHQLTGDSDQAKVLRIIHNAKLSAEAFCMMRAARKQHQPPRLTTLDVPTSWTTFNFEEENLDKLEHPKEAQEWTTIKDAREIERYLLLRNRLHFHQAHGTPLTVPPFSNLVDWLATSDLVKNILGGQRLSTSLSDITSTILSYCQYQMEVVIPSQITVEQVQVNRSSTLNVSHLPVGSYLLELRSESGERSRGSYQRGLALEPDRLDYPVHPVARVAPRVAGQPRPD